MFVVHDSKSLARSTQPLAPNQLAEIAPRQQGEDASDDAGPEIQLLHGFSVAGDVARRQIPEGLVQAEQGQRNEQMDGRVAPEVGQLEVADEQACERGPQHAGDPGVAQGAVQLGAKGGAHAGPEDPGADGDGAERQAHVDGDDGRELHVVSLGWLVVPALWRGKCPISMRLRRLTVQAARDAVDGCEGWTQTGVCAEFWEAAMPKQR